MSTVNTQQDSYVSTVIVPPCRAAAAGWAASPGLRAWLDPWWASNATALAEITAALAAGPSTPTPHTHFPLPPFLQLLIDRGNGGPIVCSSVSTWPHCVRVRGTPTAHGLSSNKMALITSECGEMRSLSIKWP